MGEIVTCLKSFESERSLNQFSFIKSNRNILIGTDKGSIYNLISIDHNMYQSLLLL